LRYQGFFAGQLSHKEEEEAKEHDAQLWLLNVFSGRVLVSWDY